MPRPNLKALPMNNIFKKKFISLVIVLLAIGTYLSLPSGDADAVTYHSRYIRYDRHITDTYLRNCSVGYLTSVDNSNRLSVISRAANSACTVQIVIVFIPHGTRTETFEASGFGNVTGLTTSRSVGVTSTARVYLRACAGGFGCGAAQHVTSIYISRTSAINV